MSGIAHQNDIEEQSWHFSVSVKASGIFNFEYDI